MSKLVFPLIFKIIQCFEMQSMWIHMQLQMHMQSFAVSVGLVAPIYGWLQMWALLMKSTWTCICYCIYSHIKSTAYTTTNAVGGYVDHFDVFLIWIDIIILENIFTNVISCRMTTFLIFLLQFPILSKEKEKMKEIKASLYWIFNLIILQGKDYLSNISLEMKIILHIIFANISSLKKDVADDLS